MKIKVCGMRNAKNIKDLLKLKIDFIGFIFHNASSRNVTESILVPMPDYVKKVGVFVDKPIPFVLEKIKSYQLNYVQLHGKESVLYCEKLQHKNIKIIKAFNIDDNFNFDQLIPYENFCDFFLFDASGKLPGGNGISFNWNLLQKYTLKTPFLLSGGINDSMVNAIKNFSHKQFAGIDINSQFEIKPAFKDIDKIKKFIDNVN